MLGRAKEKTVLILFTFAVLANIALWFYGRDLRGSWQAVPPVPNQTSAHLMAFGDAQLAYRMVGIMLQNFGDTGGRSTPLREYDYEALTRWLRLADKLDPKSNFTPYLAAMYFGSVDEPSKLPPLLEYLSEVGQRPGGENWRWLAHASYLARFEMNDLELALKYARILAALPGDLPAWTRQMPGFILNAQGNKEEALAVMMQILNSGVGKYHPNEINNTIYMICHRILDESEAAVHPLCNDAP